MEDLLERVIAIAQVFGRAGIPHSFGGAIALGYYAQARPTYDIDINVYLRVDDAGRALDSLQELGVPEASDDQRARIRRDGQTRLYWDDVPLDLFFWNLEFHASCCSRRRSHALLDHTIDILSPEDLIVCKVAFGRDKDTRDVLQILDSMGEHLELRYVLHWVEVIVGIDAAPARRLTQALAQRSLLPERRARRDGSPAR
jgi:hypothetical protein